VPLALYLSVLGRLEGESVKFFVPSHNGNDRLLKIYTTWVLKTAEHLLPENMKIANWIW